MSVIVAVPVVRVVQMSSYQVVDVVTVRNTAVSTAFLMGMTAVVSATAVIRSAGCLIIGTNGQTVIVYVVFMHVVHVIVMQVVAMIVMLDGCMPAPITMLVSVFGVNFT